MYIILFLYFYLFSCSYLLLKYNHIHFLYVFFIGISIIKATLDYRICSLAYLECKIRKLERDESLINQFLDPIVNIRYTDHVYPLYIFSYSIIYIYIAKHLKEYILR